MNTELIGHVRDGVLAVRSLGRDDHGCWRCVPGHGILVRKGIASLCELTAQNLDDAVGVAMVVYWAALAGTPNEDELFRKGKFSVRQVSSD